MTRDEFVLQEGRQGTPLSVLQSKKTTQDPLYRGLISVAGVTAEDEAFYSHPPVQKNTRENLETLQQASREISEEVAESSERVLRNPKKPSTIQQSVHSFVDTKITTKVKELVRDGFVTARLVKVASLSLSFNVHTLQDALEEIDIRLASLEQSLHKPLTPADASLTIDAKEQTIAFNPKGVPYQATINGGVVRNLLDFLNVTTATLNTITALGGVNEAFNGASENDTNAANLFNKKSGTRLYFRSLVSEDGSVSFKQSKDGGTIDVSVNPGNLGELPEGFVTSTTIADKAVTFAKFAPIARSVLLGNPTHATQSPTEISLDETLEFVESRLRVNTKALQLENFGGQVTLSQLPTLSKQKLLGNGGEDANTPTELSLNPFHFILEKNSLSLAKNFLTATATPFRLVGEVVEQSTEARVVLGAANGAFVGSQLSVFGNGELLSVVGVDHSVVKFYPQGHQAGAKAVIGFDVPKGTEFIIQNTQTEDNSILLNPMGGGVGVGTQKVTADFQVGEVYSVEQESGRISQTFNAVPDAEVRGLWRAANKSAAYRWSVDTHDGAGVLSLETATPREGANELSAWQNALKINNEGQVGVHSVGFTPGYVMTVGGSERIAGSLKVEQEVRVGLRGEVGTPGQVLVSNGPGKAPTWKTKGVVFSTDYIGLKLALGEVGSEGELLLGGEDKVVESTMIGRNFVDFESLTNGSKVLIKTQLQTNGAAHLRVGLRGGCRNWIFNEAKARSVLASESGIEEVVNEVAMGIADNEYTPPQMAVVTSHGSALVFITLELIKRNHELKGYCTIETIENMPVLNTKKQTSVRYRVATNSELLAGPLVTQVFVTTRSGSASVSAHDFTLEVLEF